MAFALDIDWSRMHADVSDSATSIQLPVGYDLTSETIFSLFVLVGPTAGGIIELSFCLVETGQNIDRAIWDGRETAARIGRSDRLPIRTALCEIIHDIVQSGRFQEVRPTPWAATCLR